MGGNQRPESVKERLEGSHKPVDFQGEDSSEDRKIKLTRLWWRLQDLLPLRVAKSTVWCKEEMEEAG